jgi:hypothetical protein
MATGLNLPNQPAQVVAPVGDNAVESVTPISAAPLLKNPLGFIQSSLAGVTVNDLLKNKPALTMLLHDHNRLNHENGSLSNTLNTANTYVKGYEDTKTRAKAGAVYQAAAALPIAFSVNLLTGGNTAVVSIGWTLLAIGILFQGIGLYYAFWGEN